MECWSIGISFVDALLQYSTTPILHLSSSHFLDSLNDHACRLLDLIHAVAPADGKPQGSHADLWRHAHGRENVGELHGPVMACGARGGDDPGKASENPGPFYSRNRDIQSVGQPFRRVTVQDQAVNAFKEQALKTISEACRVRLILFKSAPGDPARSSKAYCENRVFRPGALPRWGREVLKTV